MDDRSQSRTWLRRGLLATSYILIFIAVGLAVYPFATDLLTRRQQNALADQFQARSASSSAESTPAADPWQGWAAEDRAYWEQLPLGGAMGRLTIPAMDLKTTVVKGATTSTLRKGPGWIAYTAYPGPAGTVGISGHRVTWLHPFKHLDKVHEGDTVEFVSPYRRYTYRVKRTSVVTPDRVDVLKDAATPKLVLTACHPWYSATYRLIVDAELVGVERLKGEQ